MQTPIYIPNSEAMEAFGAKIATTYPTCAVIFLQGELGTGKTTFVKGFLRAKGVHDRVKSPSYSLVEPYEIGSGLRLYHFDLYRVKSADELAAIGIRDYFQGNQICLFEWPDKFANQLPPPDLILQLSYQHEGREISVIAHNHIEQRMK